MMRLRSLIRWSRLLIAAALMLALTSPSALSTRTCAAQDNPAPRPKLAVLIYFDQFRGDYLSRWETFFGEGGFRRLMKDGAWFQQCHYPYALTYTAAGHASVATGCSPDRHGIVSNEWRERSEGKTVASVTALPNEDGLSPKRLLSPTIADALKLATHGKGRVVALSFKDRSAILPGGQKPDACYWFSSSSRKFVTSTYYRPEPHDWVETYNREQPAERWAGQSWTLLRPDVDYKPFSGPDDVVGERNTTVMGRTFPHPLGGQSNGQAPVNLDVLYCSPFGNDLLLGLAKRAIEAEKLGSRDVPDLLCLSFSSNDAIGHGWGPDSQEVMDATLRSDLIIKDLLSYLDEKVGVGKYALVLTSDHGICPLPEVTKAEGRLASRIPPDLLTSKAEKALVSRFGPADPDNKKTKWLEATEPSGLYLNQTAIAKHGLTSSAVEEELAGWLKTQDGLLDVFTRSRILADKTPNTIIGGRIQKSFRPERCGDVLPVIRPYHLFGADSATGTTHGTPHSYDTHVPLLVFGGGARPGPRGEDVTPQAAASIIAAILGIAPPAHAEAPVPERLF